MKRRHRQVTLRSGFDSVCGGVGGVPRRSFLLRVLESLVASPEIHTQTRSGQSSVYRPVSASCP